MKPTSTTSVSEMINDTECQSQEQLQKIDLLRKIRKARDLVFAKKGSKRRTRRIELQSPLSSHHALWDIGIKVKELR